MEGAEQNPQLAVDGSGTVWMMSLSRTARADAIHLEWIDQGKRNEVASLMPEGATGLAFPVIAALPAGCVLAFSVEKNQQWTIAYVVVDSKTQKTFDIHYLACTGTANIAPAVAVSNGRACLVWESNADGARGIFGCVIEGDQAGDIQRISSQAGNSYNPAVVAVAAGEFFVAWDSFLNKESNIYGAWLNNGVWGSAKQLSNDPRIERYPALATWSGEVWLCWQAQSYQGRALNSLKEQRIVVARLAGDGLAAPLHFFNDVAITGRLLMHPQIGFDDFGNLWLTARLGMDNIHAGWLPVAWTYRGSNWSGMQTLGNQQGRWQSIPLAAVPGGGVYTAIQSDDLPQNWDTTRGIYPDWHSSISIVQPPTPPAASTVEPLTEPLAMPATTFSLTDKSTLCSADLPRQQWAVGGRSLQLFWGDLHDHTDISVCNRRFNPPGKDLFANLRDIEKLDFSALTDHGYNLDGPQWRLDGEQTRYSHDPDRFVTFLAEEWTSSNALQSGGYGHHNLIFLDPFFGRFFDAFDGDITPRDVWDQLQGVDFLTIPHQLADWQGKGAGNPPNDWSYTDERLQPVAEIYQTRGSYECLGCPNQAVDGEPVAGHYLQDAWAKGIVIGVIASPDHNGGNGKVGVWAEKLDRQDIFDAIRARHTFGTTGSKIALAFSAGNAIMGDKVSRTSGPLTFSVNAHALAQISEITILRNNQIVFTTVPNELDVSLDWTDLNPFPSSGSLWYYVRLRTVNGEFAWSSPIWFL